MGPDAEILDGLREELSVEGSPLEVFHENLQIPVEHAPVLELQAGAQREVRVPIVLFAELETAPRDGPQPALPEGPWALELGAGLSQPTTEGRGVHVDQVSAAAIGAQAQGQVVGELGVQALIAQVDSVRARLAQEQLVAEMRALVEDPAERREVAEAVSHEARGEEVGVDEIERLRVEIEDREDPALHSRLPLTPLAFLADMVPVQGEGLAEADGGHVLRTGGAGVVPVGGP